MNPLLRFEQPEIMSRIPKSTMKRIEERMKYVKNGIKRVEVASNLRYPQYYIEPFLPLSSTSLERGRYGVLFARTIPMLSNNEIKIVVQISGALITFGLPGTIDAVLAHEFLHYVEFVRRFTKMDRISDETSTSLYESSYADTEHIYKPKAIFREKSLLKLIKRKFNGGLVDEKLNRKAEKDWIGRGLPTSNISPENNIRRIPISAIIHSTFDPMLKIRIDELDRITVETPKE